MTILENMANDVLLDLGVRAACLSGWKVLSKYYTLSDNSILTRGAMSKSFHLVPATDIS